MSANQTEANSTTTATEEEFSWENTLWMAHFSLVFAVSIGGNGMVLVLILIYRRLRSVTNLLLANLCFSDLLLTILNGILNSIYMVKNDWFWGPAFCTINNFFALNTVAASVFTLVVIFYEKHMVVVRPFAPRLSKTRVMFFIFLIWVLSSVIALPSLLYSKMISFRPSASQTLRKACIVLWPDGLPGKSNLDYGYNWFFFLFTYLMPIAFMSFTYTRIRRVLWGAPTNLTEVHTAAQETAVNQKKRVHTFLIYAIGLCIVGSLLEVQYPGDIRPMLVTNGGILLQGGWFYAVGFILYPPEGWPVWSLVEHDDSMWATMSFTWMLAGVIIFQVVKMLTLIVFIFGFCWMPYHVYFFLQYHIPGLMRSKHARSVYLSCYWLAMSHALVNPIILFSMVGRFRLHLRKLTYTLLLCQSSPSNSSASEGYFTTHATTNNSQTNAVINNVGTNSSINNGMLPAAAVGNGNREANASGAACPTTLAIRIRKYRAHVRNRQICSSPANGGRNVTLRMQMFNRRASSLDCNLDRLHVLLKDVEGSASSTARTEDESSPEENSSENTGCANKNHWQHQRKNHSHVIKVDSATQTNPKPCHNKRHSKQAKSELPKLAAGEPGVSSSCVNIRSYNMDLESKKAASEEVEPPVICLSCRDIYQF